MFTGSWMHLTRSTPPPATLTVDKQHKTLGFASFLLIGVALSGCATAAQNEAGPIEVATDFVRFYDQWAQSGFPEDIPQEIESISGDNTLKDLESDSRWYSQGGVRQVGSVHFRDARVLHQEDGTSTVEMSTDYSGVTLIAEGEEVNFDNTQGSSIQLFLVRNQDDTGWVVDSISPVEP